MAVSTDDNAKAILDAIPQNIKDILTASLGGDNENTDLLNQIANQMGFGQIVQKAIFQGNFGNMLDGIWQWLSKIIGQPVENFSEVLLNGMAFNNLIPKELHDSLGRAFAEMGVIEPLGILALWLVEIVLSVKEDLSLANEFIHRGYVKTYHLKEVEPRSLIRNVFVNPSTYDDVRERMQDSGYSDEAIDLMFEGERQSLPVEVIRILFQSKVMDFETAKKRLHENGYTDERLSLIIQSWLHTLSFGEVLHNSSKGSYNSQLDSLLGLSEGMPDVFTTYADNAGYTRDDAVAAWRAHWALPDPHTALIMRERGMIGNDAYKLILEYSGIAPSQIDNMTAVNYTLLPLRSLQTMYHEGVMTDDDLMREIVSHGFGDERAKIMFTWIKEGSSSSKTTKTVDRITNAYKYHALTRDQAKQALVSVRYTESDAEFALDDEDFKIALDTRKEKEATIRDAYEGRLIEEAEARSRLVGLDFAATYIDSLIERWNVRRELTIALPSKTDLDHFLEVGTMDENDYVSAMLKLRYSMDTIRMYLDYRSTKKATTQKISDTKLAQNLVIKQMEQQYKDAEISDTDVTTKMQAAGIADVVIKTYLAEWKDDHDKKAASDAAKTTSTTGA